MAQDAFQMSDSAASAKFFLGVERHHAMPRFPISLHARIAAQTEARAEGPDADHFIELPASRRNARGHGVGVVQDQNRARRERGRQQPAQLHPLELFQIGRLLDNAIENNAGSAHADRVDRGAAARRLDLDAQPLAKSIRRRLGQGVALAAVLRIPANRAHQAILFHYADRNALASRTHTDCQPHKFST